MPKARPKRKTKSRANTKPLPGWIWLVTGLIIGLSATFLPKLNQHFLTPPNTAKKTEETKIAIDSDSERIYDFYRILPELEVVVDDNKQPLSPNPSSEQTQDKPAENYILQIGSFKSNNEADALKAQLALLGVETNIEKVTVNNTLWHRVRIGPTNDAAHLRSIQTRLNNVKIKAILVKARS